jgi:hypothetical protein
MNEGNERERMKDLEVREENNNGRYLHGETGGRQFQVLDLRFDPRNLLIKSYPFETERDGELVKEN